MNILLVTSLTLIVTITSFADHVADVKYGFEGTTAQENKVTVQSPGFGEYPLADISFGSVLPESSTFPEATDRIGVTIIADPGEGATIFGQVIQTTSAAMIRCSVRLNREESECKVSIASIDEGQDLFVSVNTAQNGKRFGGRYRRITNFFVPPSSGFRPLIQIVNFSDKPLIAYIDNLEIFFIESINFYSGEFINGDELDPDLKILTPTPTTTTKPSISIETIYQDCFTYFQMLRNDKGIYRDSLIFNGTQYHPSSIASTGMGLISICVAHKMGWISYAEAEEMVAITLTNMLGLKPDVYNPERNASGYFCHYINMDSGAREWNSGYSSIDNGIFVSGALFCKKYFKSQKIADLVNLLWSSIDWSKSIANSEKGFLYMDFNKDGTGIVNSITSPYSEYMIVSWLAMNAENNENGPAHILWNKYYSDPDKLLKIKYENISLLTDNPSYYQSHFTMQFPYYLCHYFTTSEKYLSYMANAQKADRLWWSKVPGASSHQWGLGAGDSPFGNGYEANSINNNNGNIFSPHIIAGFIPVYQQGIEDIQSLLNEKKGLYFLPDTEPNSFVLWRSSVSLSDWSANGISGVNYATMMFGLASLPEYLGTDFFSDNNNFFTVDPEPPQNINLEFESGKFKGVTPGELIKQRTNASSGRTMWLHTGDSCTLTFSTTVKARYDIQIRYSNDTADGDNRLETASVYLNGIHRGDFSAKDTSKPGSPGGSGWNTFETSSISYVDIPAGTHEITVSITGGDGYGIELDICFLIPTPSDEFPPTFTPTPTFTPIPTFTPTPTFTRPNSTILLECEKGEFKGVPPGELIKKRTNASSGRTMWLHTGDSCTLTFSTTVNARYDILIRYSNDTADGDNRLETVSVVFDGNNLGDFTAKDTSTPGSPGGSGWNTFETSSISYVDIPAGTHEITVSITGGDGYGVELDYVKMQ